MNRSKPSLRAEGVAILETKANAFIRLLRRYASCNDILITRAITVSGSSINTSTALTSGASVGSGTSLFDGWVYEGGTAGSTIILSAYNL